MSVQFKKYRLVKSENFEEFLEANGTDHLIHLHQQMFQRYF